jgi:hypothetical protein
MQKMRHDVRKAPARNNWELETKTIKNAYYGSEIWLLSWEISRYWIRRSSSYTFRCGP